MHHLKNVTHLCRVRLRLPENMEKFTSFVHGFMRFAKLSAFALGRSKCDMPIGDVWVCYDIHPEEKVKFDCMQ